VFALGSTVVGCSAEDAARNVAHTSSRGRCAT
jgi:hypothetical protein